ncbi:hypothetical protein ABPG75_011741 [Micractinium tetrahymenae]
MGLAEALPVLFGIRPSHQYEALKARRIYFVIDLLSPWAALAVLDWNAPAALLALCAGHAALHIFYILTWHSRHTDRVIRLSSSDTHRRFGGGYAAAEVAWYYVGTAFDILTHAAVLRQLLAPPDVL